VPATDCKGKILVHSVQLDSFLGHAKDMQVASSWAIVLAPGLLHLQHSGAAIVAHSGQDTPTAFCPA